MMRRVFLLGLVVTALPSALDAQSVDEQIARAVMAAPANLQADAAVITFDESGEIVVVREGSNGLMCWDSSNEPGRQGMFNAQCTSELNRTRVKQNHQFSHAGGTPEEIQALFDRAEEDGTAALLVLQREEGRFGDSGSEAGVLRAAVHHVWFNPPVRRTIY